MEERISKWQSLKPGVPRRWLLGLAALTWAFAGAMLMWKGIGYSRATDQLWWKVPLGIAGGLVFYILVFQKLSARHSRRIIELEPDRPCVFSFFSLKSYLMMGLMITMGISLRHLGIIPVRLIPLVYFGMGIPLLLSSWHFFRVFFK